MFSIPFALRRPVSFVRSVSRCATVGLVAAAACVYDARIPSQPSGAATAARAPQFAAVARGAATNNRHIVTFSGSVPTDFAAQLAALGGKVLWVSSRSGLAAVSGLQGSAAATLAGKRGIQAVAADALIPLDVPLLATEATAEAGGVQSNAAPVAAVRYPRQWNMRAVRADVAWARGFLGSSSVSIFMLDSGIDPHHADTEGRVDATRSVGLLNKVFNYARSKGVTVVVSAGNSAADLDHDGNTYWTFCNTPSVICVAATGPTSDANATSPNPNLVRNGPWTNIDAPAYYTNFGRSAINVAAPGGNSSFGPPLAAPAGRDVFVWAACSQTSLIVGCFSSPFFILGAQGTSMAAPHVTGTAALLVSILGRNPSQIKARIQQSADNVAGNGTTPFYGKGRLNVARAVGAIP